MGVAYRARPAQPAGLLDQFRITARMSASLCTGSARTEPTLTGSVRGARSAPRHGNVNEGRNARRPTPLPDRRGPCHNGHREFARSPLLVASRSSGPRTVTSWTHAGGRWAAAGKGTLEALSPSSPPRGEGVLPSARSPPIARLSRSTLPGGRRLDETRRPGTDHLLQAATGVRLGGCPRCSTSELDAVSGVAARARSRGHGSS